MFNLAIDCKETLKLFWKKWPYKVIVGFPSPTRVIDFSNSVANFEGHRHLNRTRRAEVALVAKWVTENFPESGIRLEKNLSIFVSTESDFINLIDGLNDERAKRSWRPEVIDAFRPINAQALEIMKDHMFDVVRRTYWYQKYPIRARILYTAEFRAKGISVIQNAVEQLDTYCAGMLYEQLYNKSPKVHYAYGQPYYLYLKTNEDAAMLKLMASEWIDRFERIRKPF